MGILQVLLNSQTFNMKIILASALLIVVLKPSEAGVSENTHVNNLLESTTTNTVSGWTIDCNHGVWTRSWKNCQNWYGWSDENGDKVGSIITTLSGSGCARLDFGNCHSTGTVKAFLDE